MSRRRSANDMQNVLKNVNLEPILSNMMRAMDGGSNDLQFGDVVRDVAAAMERANAGSRLQEQSGSSKSNDVSYNLPISIEELFNGKTKKLLIQRSRYDGTTDIKEDYRFTVATTPGMRSGQVLTFAGIADQRKDEMAGDVLVTISVDEHEHFSISNGYDLAHSVGISLLDAFELEYALPTHPNGESYVIRYKNLEEPLYLADTKTVPGLGMPKPDGSFGDLVLSFDLQLPSSLTQEQFESCFSSDVFEKASAKEGKEFII